MENSGKSSDEKTLVKISVKSNLRPIVNDGDQISNLHAQLLLISANTQASSLFCEPQERPSSSGNIEIYWYSTLKGQIRSYPTLDEQARLDLLRAVADRMERLHRSIEQNVQLDAIERRDALEAVEKAFEIPSLACLHSIDGRPVITDWGFVENHWQAPQGVIRRELGTLPPPDPPPPVQKPATWEAPPAPAVIDSAPAPAPDPRIGKITLQFRDGDAGLFLAGCDVVIALNRRSSRVERVSRQCDADGRVEIDLPEGEVATLNIKGRLLDGRHFKLTIRKAVAGKTFQVSVTLRRKGRRWIFFAALAAFLALLLAWLMRLPQPGPGAVLAPGDNLVLPDTPQADFEFAEGEWIASSQLLLTDGDKEIDLVFRVSRSGTGMSILLGKDDFTCEAPITMSFEHRVLTLRQTEDARCHDTSGKGRNIGPVTRGEFACTADNQSFAQCEGKNHGQDTGFSFHLVRK